MADISMSYYALEDLASDIGQLKEQLNAAKEELNQLISTTDGRWKGCAQLEFAAAYDKLRPKLQSMNDVLECYQAELQRTMEREKETEHLSALHF